MKRSEVAPRNRFETTSTKRHAEKDGSYIYPVNNGIAVQWLTKILKNLEFLGIGAKDSAKIYDYIYRADKLFSPSQHDCLIQKLKLVVRQSERPIVNREFVLTLIVLRRLSPLALREPDFAVWQGRVLDFYATLLGYHGILCAAELLHPQHSNKWLYDTAISNRYPLYASFL
jgi:hypothetical protein